MAVTNQNAFPNIFPGTQVQNNVPSQATPEARPQAELWLNVGYEVPHTSVVDGVKVQETRFISLPVGIPVDTMDHVATNQRSEDYRNLQHARNNLLDHILAKSQELKPGESVNLNLTIQLRRVDSPADQAPSEHNAYIIPLSL